MEVTETISPMLEKVADAMRRDYARNPTHCWEERARAAITALMEPDEAMLEAGTRHHPYASLDPVNARLETYEAFRAMLQTVLEQPNQQWREASPTDGMEPGEYRVIAPPDVEAIFNRGFPAEKHENIRTHKGEG